MKKLLVFLMLLMPAIACWGRSTEDDLYKAIMERDLDLLKEVVKNGVNLDITYPNLGEKTPLMQACAQDWYQGTEYLLRVGRASSTVKRPETGETALMFAARYCQNDVVVKLLLLTYGANPNAQDAQGKTPLMYAVENRSDSVFSTLIKYGANYNAVDLYDNTVLMYCIKEGYVFGVDVLLKESGTINLSQENRSGDTILSLACESGNKQIFQKLVKNNKIDWTEKNSDGEPPLIWMIKNKKSQKLIEILLRESNLDEEEILSIRDSKGDARFWANRKNDKNTLRILNEIEASIH